jgi:enamine deaminase RidA (YjgF/YER057c/UK114 family)
MNISTYRSGAPWEIKVGYSRAVRVGQTIWVSGTAPVAEDGSTFRPGDAYQQARRCCEIIVDAVRQLGGTTAVVVRTRMFVTDITLWESFGKAHEEFFGEHAPATSMVEVRALIGSDMLIEIEAEAIVTEP